MKGNGGEKDFKVVKKGMKDIVPISDSDRVYDGVRTSVGRIYSVPNQVYV